VVVQLPKLSNFRKSRSSDWGPKIYYLEILCASESTLSCWSWLYLRSLAPTNLHWARVVGCGPFSLYVINKEGLYPFSGSINRLMMTIMTSYTVFYVHFIINSKIKHLSRLFAINTIPRNHLYMGHVICVSFIR
jgi:hypothetical protein